MTTFPPLTSSCPYWCFLHLPYYKLSPEAPSLQSTAFRNSGWKRIGRHSPGNSAGALFPFTVFTILSRITERGWQGEHGDGGLAETNPFPVGLGKQPADPARRFPAQGNQSLPLPSVWAWFTTTHILTNSPGLLTPENRARLAWASAGLVCSVSCSFIHSFVHPCIAGMSTFCCSAIFITIHLLL